jgi:hypothetical protein
VRQSPRTTTRSVIPPWSEQDAFQLCEAGEKSKERMSV